MNLIREAFDEEDLDTMKNFVKSELESDNQFYFPSGKTTSRMNLGQIIKIAFELKHFTQKALDEMDSEEEEDDPTAESLEKRSQLQSWFQFCDKKVSVIEKTWNRKLENPTPETDDITSEYSEESKGKGDEHESTIEKMLMRFSTNRLSRSRSDVISGGDSVLQADIAAGIKKESKDDVFNKEPKTGEFGDNQFWKKPEMYDIDELLAEQGNQ